MRRPMMLGGGSLGHSFCASFRLMIATGADSRRSWPVKIGRRPAVFPKAQ